MARGPRSPFRINRGQVPRASQGHFRWVRHPRAPRQDRSAQPRSRSSATRTPRRQRRESAAWPSPCRGLTLRNVQPCCPHSAVRAGRRSGSPARPRSEARMASRRAAAGPAARRRSVFASVQIVHGDGRDDQCIGEGHWSPPRASVPRSLRYTRPSLQQPLERECRDRDPPNRPASIPCWPSSPPASSSPPVRRPRARAARAHRPPHQHRPRPARQRPALRR